jgi:hypothetical protein
MANTTQDEIYKNFLDVSQGQSAQMTVAVQSMANLILQAEQVRGDYAQQAAGKATPSGSSGGNTSGGSNSGGGGDSVLSTVFDVFKSGLGVSPLVRGIMGLFGGGDTPAPAPLVKYALPPAINFQAAEVNGQIASGDYDQTGMPRGYAPATAATISPAAGGTATGPGVAAPQITVNVQAMDARSLMDRSNDIALAVRDAMLNLNAINDVVNDL